MFIPFKKKPVDVLIDDLALKMSQTPPHTEAYAQMSKNLEVLVRAKALMAQNRGLSMDAALGVAANLLSVVMILNYEKVNVISTRAMSFVSKNRP